MKRSIYILITGLFPLILTAQWYPQNSGTDLGLNSVSFSDSLNGWVVGEEGLVLHTSDGGNTWEEQESGTSTSLTFELTQPERVEIQIFNQLGELARAVQLEGQQGANEFTWKAEGYPPGIYFIRLQINEKLQFIKIMKL